MKVILIRIKHEISSIEPILIRNGSREASENFFARILYIIRPRMPPIEFSITSVMSDAPREKTNCNDSMITLNTINEKTFFESDSFFNSSPNKPPNGMNIKTL